jgi:molybdopterin-guanine dinucleotide biosynthesis protein A
MEPKSKDDKIRATVIIMAGGNSSRMGQDKSILPINGVAAVKHVLDQFKPYFDQILISTNNVVEHSLEGAEVVLDEAPGKGPLMGIASGLRVSRNDINFVAACDIPEVNIELVRRLIDESKDVDAVLPQSGPNHYEPLFAVYKKSTLAAIDESIKSGNYKIVDSLKKCKVRYVELSANERLRNLNTMKDYLQFVEDKNNTII